MINSDKEKEKIFASIEYASLPPTSDFFVRVFINMPAANSETPPDDPHFAGTFAFFGTQVQDGMQHEEHKPNFLVNITDTLLRLKQRGELKDNEPITVNLVAVPFSGKFEKQDTQLVLEKLEIIVTPVIIKGEQN